MLKALPDARLVKKIGILRANAIGDLIVTLPAINALTKKFPQAEIVLLGLPWHKEFCPERTLINRVIVVPVKKGIRQSEGVAENEEEIAAFLQQMRQENFDLVINFQGNGLSANPFIKQFGAKITAGLACSAAEKPDVYVNYVYAQSEVLRYLEVVELLGAAPQTIEPQVTVLNNDKLEIESFVSRLDKPFVVLHPVAMDVRRMWPIERYAPLADSLIDSGFEVVFTGSLQDEGQVNSILKKMKNRAHNVCGRFGLGGLAALLSQARLVVGADTGPIHLARAVNTPTIGFYWAPNLINWGPLNRNKHRPLVSWKMACEHCGIIPNDPYPYLPVTAECNHNYSFVRDIQLQQVLNTVKELLHEWPAPRTDGTGTNCLATAAGCTTKHEVLIS